MNRGEEEHWDGRTDSGFLKSGDTLLLPEASMHSDGNVSGGPQRLHVLEVCHVVHRVAGLPPFGAFSSLETLCIQTHKKKLNKQPHHQYRLLLLLSLTISLHKHLPDRLALTLWGGEQGMLGQWRRGVADDVILRYVQLIRKLRLDNFRLPEERMAS